MLSAISSPGTKSVLLSFTWGWALRSRVLVRFALPATVKAMRLSSTLLLSLMIKRKSPGLFEGSGNRDPLAAIESDALLTEVSFLIDWYLYTPLLCFVSAET